MYGHTYSKSTDQPGKVANPARGQLNRINEYSPVRVQFVPENLVSRDGFGSPVPRQPAHLHTQAESGAYLRVSSRVPLYKYDLDLTSLLQYVLYIMSSYSADWAPTGPGMVAQPFELFVKKKTRNSSNKPPKHHT